MHLPEDDLKVEVVVIEDRCWRAGWKGTSVLAVVQDAQEVSGETVEVRSVLDGIVGEGAW